MGECVDVNKAHVWKSNLALPNAENKAKSYSSEGFKILINSFPRLVDQKNHGALKDLFKPMSVVIVHFDIENERKMAG